MMPYLSRFDAMVAALKEHPLLEVPIYQTHPPVEDKTIKKVEKLLEAPLDASIAAFYKETNGIRIHWKVSSDLPGKLWDKACRQYNDYDFREDDDEDPDYENPFAQIRILPLEDCFFNRKWKDWIYFEKLSKGKKITFAGTDHDRLAFEKCLKPFDLFSNFACMAFVAEKGNGNPAVIHLDDHYAVWQDSRITDFASYIEMLLATRGISRARNKIYYKNMGHAEDKLITNQAYFQQAHVPKLFRS